MEESGSPDNDIRDYVLMDKINKMYDTLNNKELEVVHNVINLISQHLDDKHFNKKIDINVKALVKTFGELDEIGIEKLINSQ
jgi:hypothetical protein